MNTSSQPIRYTLDDIVRQKADTQVRLHKQKEKMKALGREIFAPAAPAAGKMGAWMQTFNTGMAIFDGALLGIRLIRRLKKSFFSR